MPDLTTVAIIFRGEKNADAEAIKMFDDIFGCGCWVTSAFTTEPLSVQLEGGPIYNYSYTARKR